MMDQGLFTALKRYKIPSFVNLCNPDAEMRPYNPPRGFIVTTEDILRCVIKVPLLPYFERLLKYYGLSLMQLTPNSYRHMATLLMAYKQLNFWTLPLKSLHIFIHSKKIQGTTSFITPTNGILAMSRHFGMLKATWASGKVVSSKWNA